MTNTKKDEQILQKTVLNLKVRDEDILMSERLKLETKDRQGTKKRKESLRSVRRSLSMKFKNRFFKLSY